MAASDYVPIFFKYRLRLAGRPQMSTRLGKSGPVSPTVAPYPPSTTTLALATTSGPSGSRLGCDRSSVVFLLYK